MQEEESKENNASVIIASSGLKLSPSSPFGRTPSPPPLPLPLPASRLSSRVFDGASCS